MACSPSCVALLGPCTLKVANADSKRDAAGPRTVVSQDSTPSDDDVDDDASPASAPESILGGIYEGERHPSSDLKMSSLCVDLNSQGCMEAYSASCPSG